MNNKQADEITKGLAAIVMAAIAAIAGYFKGKKDGHKKGVKDANKQNNENLEEIKRKYSNQ